MEKVRLHLMVNIIRRDRESRWGSSRMSSFTRAMSAASTAMSLPMPPMAMPTWARFSAGASLTPSPTMHTGCPAAWLRSMKASLSSGRHSAWKAVMPSCPAMRRAAPAWSPVSSTGVTPAAFTRATVSAASGRTVSARARKPAGRPSAAMQITVQPSSR